MPFVCLVPVRLFGGFVPRRMASCKEPICRIDVLCCVVLWFKPKYKVKIKLHKYCERKRNTANEWTTHLHCFGAKLLTAKEILLMGNYYSVLLKKQR